MPDRVAALRRFVLTPKMSETTFAVRGFRAKSEAKRERLESAGRTFLTGYGHAAEARTATAAESGLEGVDLSVRGFGYEGAGMAFAMRDGLPVGHGHHVADFLTGRADRHRYMVYVGVGWAFARLPRMRWAAAAAGATDPLLRWLSLDGYGFHQAYFHTGKYVHEQFRSDGFRSPMGGSVEHANRVIDQGIGRAMWFVCGADPDRIAETVEGFAEDRRADLYSGAGLAATYAGGVDEAELRALADHAGPHRGALAQGSAFAAEARRRAGLVVPHVELATEVLCGMSVDDAAAVTVRTLPGSAGPLAAYEQWRHDIAAEIGRLSRL